MKRADLSYWQKTKTRRFHHISRPLQKCKTNMLESGIDAIYRTFLDHSLQAWILTIQTSVDNLKQL